MTVGGETADDLAEKSVRTKVAPAGTTNKSTSVGSGVVRTPVTHPSLTLSGSGSAEAPAATTTSMATAITRHRHLVIEASLLGDHVTCTERGRSVTLSRWRFKNMQRLHGD